MDNNRLVTSQVTDANGNYLSIIYNSVTCEAGCYEYCYCPIYWPPLTISHIIDSLGRITQFNYDSELKLISITAPGFGGTVQNPVTQTVVQFDYESRTISASFSGLTVENLPTGAVSFIKHIYYPATQTGAVQLFEFWNGNKSLGAAADDHQRLRHYRWSGKRNRVV
jgi:YD repeat-containing protein